MPDRAALVRVQESIEVTPEMIEAGLEAYNAWYATPAGDTGPLDGMVTVIFRAMAQCRKIRVSNIPQPIPD